MAKKIRNGKFLWEKRPNYISDASFRGVHDPAFSCDCRCGTDCSSCQFEACCNISPWVALSSSEAWGEEHLTPDGLPDGDTANPRGRFIPFEELDTCDLYGRRLDERDTDEEGTFLDSSTEDENEWPISALL